MPADRRCVEGGGGGKWMHLNSNWELCACACARVMTDGWMSGWMKGEIDMC
jgi:hypothetical protein